MTLTANPNLHLGLFNDSRRQKQAGHLGVGEAQLQFTVVNTIANVSTVHLLSCRHHKTWHPLSVEMYIQTKMENDVDMNEFFSPTSMLFFDIHRLSRRLTHTVKQSYLITLIKNVIVGSSALWTSVVIENAIQRKQNVKDVREI